MENLPDIENLPFLATPLYTFIVLYHLYKTSKPCRFQLTTHGTAYCTNICVTVATTICDL